MVEIVKVRVNGADVTVSIPPSMREAFINAGHAIVKCNGNTAQFSPVQDVDA